MEVEDSGGVVLTAYHSYARSQPPASDARCAPRAAASHPLSRKSIPRCRRINRMLSNESLHPPAFSRSNSQASVDSASMEDFWREIESIHESSTGARGEELPSEIKPVDEGELEAEWLQDVGLSTLISGEEEEDGKALLSTLTRTQAAAVKKRYNTYTQTLRKKSKQPVRDVRDVFGVSKALPDASCDEHTTQLDGTPEEKQLPEVINTSDPMPQDAPLDSPALCNGPREEEGSLSDPGSSSTPCFQSRDSPSSSVLLKQCQPRPLPILTRAAGCSVSAPCSSVHMRAPASSPLHGISGSPAEAAAQDGGWGSCAPE